MLSTLELINFLKLKGYHIRLNRRDMMPACEDDSLVLKSRKLQDDIIEM